MRWGLSLKPALVKLDRFTWVNLIGSQSALIGLICINGVTHEANHTIVDSPRKLMPDVVRLKPGRTSPSRLVVRDLRL